MISELMLVTRWERKELGGKRRLNPTEKEKKG